MALLDKSQIIYFADSHVVEPADLWIEYIDPEFRDRAPHLEQGITRADGTRVEGEFLVCDGIAPQRVATFAAADVDDPRKRAEAGQRGYAQIRQGGWDPKARIADQDVDGVAFEVLYPSMAMPMFSLTDTPYQQAVFRAYNDWVADFVKAAPGRLAGVALISLDDIDAGVAEMRRARDLGLRGAMIWNDPGDGRTYADEGFDPVWTTAADLDMPISLHILTGKQGTGLGTGKPFLADYIALTHPVQVSLTAMLST
ncbi:MAG: amidohydrolase family protein, partial [Gammaproteobacteria bacterium]